MSDDATPHSGVPGGERPGGERLVAGGGVTDAISADTGIPTTDGGSLRRTSNVSHDGWGRAFAAVCLLSTWFGVLVLAVLMVGVFVTALPALDGDFLTNFDSPRRPSEAGVLAGLWGSFWLIVLTIGFSVPVGVGAALYLEEYARPTRLTRLVQINLANLAGVPSIVYGILGATVFVRMFNAFGDDVVVAIPPTSMTRVPIPFSDSVLSLAQLRVPLPFGPTVISGALTLTLLILPVIIVASQEALRAVPGSIRQAAIALGASKWQTTRGQVLPAAAPGILTGVILAISRAVGETAPLIMLGIRLFTWATPGGITSVSQMAGEPSRILDVPFSDYTVMPYLIYGWAQSSKPEFFAVAAAAIVVLLCVLLALNSVAIVIRNHFQKHARW